jgi:hypothetical protein
MLVKSSERGREVQSRVGVIYGGAVRLEVAAGQKASNMLVQWPEKSMAMADGSCVEAEKMVRENTAKKELGR